MSCDLLKEGKIRGSEAEIKGHCPHPSSHKGHFLKYLNLSFTTLAYESRFKGN